jgi:alpha-tubulin suppressor-like RCC1 family protein
VLRLVPRQTVLLVSAVTFATVALLTPGTAPGSGGAPALGWGANISCEVGDGTNTPRHVPVQVQGLSGVTALAESGNHSLAVASDGTVWAWGDEHYGLDGGSILTSCTPVQVQGLTGVVAVAAGANDSFALRGDGTVWAWGWNGFGQLGNGTNTDSRAPVQVEGLSGVTAIASQGESSLALRSDGTVWAWGANSVGELGNGNTADSATAVEVDGLSGVTAIASNGGESLALASDGTVWAWGYNAFGQLGDGTATNRSTPIHVLGLSGVAAIAAGAEASYAVLSDGTVWSWGCGCWGDLGNGDVTETGSRTPVQVAGPSHVVAIAAGEYFCLVLDSDGTLWAWGDDTNGELGDGSVTPDGVPLPVQLNNVTAHSDAVFALGGDTALLEPSAAPSVTGLSPGSGGLAGGDTITVTGHGLLSARWVTVGGVVATNLHVVSATKLTVATPAHAIGGAYVRVSNADGSSAISSLNRFAYVDTPTVSGLSSPAGGTAGGQKMTIFGSGFLTASDVSFGDDAATFTVVSDTRITATSPAHAAGQVDVTVTNPHGISATGTGDQYTFESTPTVTAVSPDSGAVAGGDTITVTGSDLLNARWVTVGGVIATNLNVVSATELTVTTPAHSVGATYVRVTTWSGSSAAGSFNRFTYVDTPTVSGLSSPAGGTAGGQKMTIFGSGFLTASNVSFGDTEATSFSVVSDTRITATSPAHAAGQVDVTVTNPYGTSATGDGDRYAFESTPTVTAVSPDSGAVAGGDTIIVTGTALLSTRWVTIGGVVATNVHVVSATELTVTTPAHIAGAAYVRVTNAEGSSAASSGNRFTYVG